MGYDIKSIRQDFKEKGIFYTQPELALYLKGFLPDDVKEIYDPTCGNGGLLSVFNDEVQKYGQDINEEQVRDAEMCLQNFHGVIGDTLKEPAFMDRKFKYIIANPPFSIKWEPKRDERFDQLPCLPPPSKADYAFIAHILHYLTEDGTAVVLNFPGILYRGNAEGKIRRWMIEQNYIDTVISVDGGQFVDTKIGTAVLILKKNRDTTDVRFMHNDLERVVPVSEIKGNDFQLSVSSYIIEIAEKEEIDPIALEMHARKVFLERLDKELAFEKTICEIEKLDMQPFIRAIKSIVRQYDRPKKRAIFDENKLTMNGNESGVAAVNTGRSFIGMELDPGYFETARKRIEEARETAKQLGFSDLEAEA